MKKRLFITDLDGTALGGSVELYARFPDHFSAFLDRLVRDGWEWAINTTWDPEGQWKLVLNSKLQSRPVFLIGEFGRQLIQVRDGRLEPVQPYCEKMEKKLHQFTTEILGPMFSLLFREFPPKRLLDWGHLFSYCFYDTDDMREIKPLIAEYLANPALKVTWNSHCFSGGPAFLGKGLALQELIVNHGYDRENIVCAGDETADLDMMRLGGYSLCPSNAVEAVKAYIADSGGIIGNQCFASGVIEAFERLEKSGVFHEFGHA